ncbi:DUF6302 family protein [Streptomyces hundungensis]|uniref:DUF6302 family protein n=1 Tax=Streptomyces hundungensis TaxID=1077946 RepID=UPI0033CDF75A
MRPPAIEPDTLLVTVLPVQDAYDYEFVAARLHDQHLLHASVAIRVFRAPLLAVPVGGRRRGGCIDTADVNAALAIREALVDRPGFPNVRIRLATAPDRRSHWAVEWGEPLPDHLTDSERALFYGAADHCIPPERRNPARTPDAVTAVEAL